MKLCPTCGGSPGKRMWLAVGMPHEDKPINVVMCEDPLHDAADRVGEIVEDSERLRQLLWSSREMLECAEFKDSENAQVALFVREQIEKFTNAQVFATATEVHRDAQAFDAAIARATEVPR